VAELELISALRIEAWAVGGEVRVSGIGPAKAGAVSAGAQPKAFAMVGVAGGVARGLAPGDVVVPDELRTSDGVVRRIPMAPMVAAALAQSGLSVRCGPMLSVPKMSRRDELAGLRSGGVLAVDMESAWVADALGPVPFVVVRTIADTAETGVVRGGIRALASLRRVRPALEAWARSVGPRRVELAAARSFCAGVERAIEIVERAIDRFGAPVYVRRQIVHNAHVVADLEAKGAIFVGELSEVPENATVVLAAHGVSPVVRAQAAARPSLSVIDATCPLVAKVHNEARRFAGQGRRILLVGHEGHDEVVGTLGEVPDGIHLIADASDVAALPFSADTPVAYLTQTTLAVDETAGVLEAVKARFGDVVGPSADDICYASQNRQDAVATLAERCQLVLVVGSANSSNAQRLVEVAQRHGSRAHLVDDATQIDLDWLADTDSVGVTAAASTPESLVEELVESLRALGPLEVTEHRTAEESVRFSLPLQVR
jgi:4-hydroxy-3-methylbut-2-en-1-yl diphosphate reductase